MDALPPIAATVIGSWSFPGWYDKFCADAAAHPDLYGADDRADDGGERQHDRPTADGTLTE